MKKSLLEKLNDKLVLTADTKCYGKLYYSVSLTKVSDVEFDMNVIAEDCIAAALFGACKPQKYSNKRIIYSNEKAEVVNYEGKSGCYKLSARMTVC